MNYMTCFDNILKIVLVLISLMLINFSRLELRMQEYSVEMLNLSKKKCIEESMIIIRKRPIEETVEQEKIPERSRKFERLLLRTQTKCVKPGADSSNNGSKN